MLASSIAILSYIRKSQKELLEIRNIVNLRIFKCMGKFEDYSTKNGEAESRSGGKI